MSFNEIDIKTMKINPFVMLNDEWALLSAGNVKKHNTMTIAWGAMGIMWGKPVFTVVVRPQRYTKEFMEIFSSFSVTFFPENNRDALQLLGTKSGRDCDKISESKLTPIFIDDTLAFEEAHTIFMCKKLYGGQQLSTAGFIDLELDFSMYPGKDHHYFYIGEIEKVLVKE